MDGMKNCGQVIQRRFYRNSLGSILHRLVIINETRLLLCIHSLEERHLIFLEKAIVMKCAMLNGSIFPIRFNKIAEICTFSTLCVRHHLYEHKKSPFYTTMYCNYSINNGFSNKYSILLFARYYRHLKCP